VAAHILLPRLTNRRANTQEEEARLKPGTLKATAFAVMKARGVTGPVSAEDIVRITTTDGSRIDWTDKSKRTLTSVSCRLLRVGCRC
jgi:hypothetical protein